jgi:FkbM family methyltransferase
MAREARDASVEETMGTSTRQVDALTAGLLAVAQRLPRGARPTIALLARLNPKLRDYTVPMRFFPERRLRLDLRSPDSLTLLRNGCYPYQVAEERLAARLIRPDDVVYDVGANVGYLTLVFLECVGPKGRVHAFEPSARAFGYLRRNVSPTDPVELHCRAVGSREGSIEFAEHGVLAYSSVAGFGTPYSSTLRPARRYPVEVVTLDAYHARTGGPAPRFVKIDVEGYEVEVFRGMRRLLAEAEPILLFEAASAETVAANFAAIREASPHAYRFARIAHDQRLVPLEDLDATSNYLAIPGWAAERVRGLDLPERSDDVRGSGR